MYLGAVIIYRRRLNKHESFEPMHILRIVIQSLRDLWSTRNTMQMIIFLLKKSAIAIYEIVLGLFHFFSMIFLYWQRDHAYNSFSLNTTDMCILFLIIEPKINPLNLMNDR